MMNDDNDNVAESDTREDQNKSSENEGNEEENGLNIYFFTGIVILLNILSIVLIFYGAMYLVSLFTDNMVKYAVLTVLSLAIAYPILAFVNIGLSSYYSKKNRRKRNVLLITGILILFIHGTLVVAILSTS